MEENDQSIILEGEVVGIKFGLATHKEISTASVNDFPISHSSQLTNPFLGLPLEFGKCESCGTSEPGKCEGHFGFIELPIPIYHPSHISELKRMLSLLCLKCLKLKTNKFPKKSNSVAERLMSCCEEASQILIEDIKKSDNAYFLQLKLPKMRLRDGCWNFLERYGFRYGDDYKRTRTLLPCEVMEMLKRIPMDSRKKLARKGYFPQDGYIMKYLPVPPNCLSIPDISDGVSVMSSDLSISMLRKVLKQVETIKSSRSGPPNFVSHEVEAIDLQSAVDQYLQVRGTTKAARDVVERFGIHKESAESLTKVWLEKMRTLFIRKGSGFSSRSVITGDAYKRVNEIGIPSEIAQRITFEERVNVHNVKYLQELVDNKMCLLYRDGSSAYSLREGSKGHTFLRPGQVVHRRIMDGDKVFINRPPTTHKHSLQALSVYVHDDHTVKINPLICGPLSADFDGDCIHLFYPQSLGAKAEVLELFSIEKQLLSSHSGNLNLQMTTDSLLSLKTMFKEYFLDKAAAQQLAMFVSSCLPSPALWKGHLAGPIWTVLQILQTALPSQFDCIGDRYLISKGDLVKVDFSRDIVQAVINEIVISIFFEKGSDAAFKFFNSLQPLLMENLFSQGFSVGLQDFYMSRAVMEIIREDLKDISPLLSQLRSTYNELVELQLETHLRHTKIPVAEFILKSSLLGDLIDFKSDSAMTKVVQQIGFLGLQISDRGKFYSKTLVEDMASHFKSQYPSHVFDYPSAQHGLIRSCFFHGLDPYEEMVHSISTREVIVRSSRGLSEPGTLFKNLMAILRDVVICYDGTVRNVCSNSIIQFEYGVNAGNKAQILFPAGEPVGVLAATAMSNPAYKAVLDSTPSSNSSWEMMKEILLCKVNFKNDLADRRIILYFNDCACGRNYCQEKASYLLKNHLEKVILKDIAKCFMIEYRSRHTIGDAGLIGHIHLNKMKLQELNVSLEVIHQKCREVIRQKCREKIKSSEKKKKIAQYFRGTEVSVSECCSFQLPCGDERSGLPCLMFFRPDITDIDVEKSSDVLADIICPVLLETIIKGDRRVSSANIIWVSPDTTTWIRNPGRMQNGELALDVVVEKSAVKQSGDAWRILFDACVPVLHLIDTARSIPYAIKQVQELLGVPCAFDQAVQRLSTSVAMVAKGVLKEHLILLANSMTCTGNLVGFNSGGYKSLSRSLDIQVPFTEATLFTPRKCFERAAEKCHVDTLSSVVASCSWGKHVAVGTGSRFDVLWDQKEACVNQEGSIDVYEFLNMVRNDANGEESVPGCLGAEVDDLFLDDGADDWNLSPECNFGSEKPTFDDSAEFQSYLDVQPAVPDSSNGWNTMAASETDATDSWSGWGTRKTEAPDIPMMKTQEGTGRSIDEDTAAAWDLPNKEGDNRSQKQQEWGISKSPKDSHGWESSNATSSHGWEKPKGGRIANAVRQQQWGEPESPKDTGGWGSSKAVSSQGWGLPNEQGNDIAESKQQWGKPKSPENSNGWGASKAASTQDWGLQIKERTKDAERQQQWGKPNSSEDSHDWSSSKAASSQGWELTNEGGAADIEKQQQWGKLKSTEVSKGGVSHKESDDAKSFQSWGLPNEGGADDAGKQQQWGKPQSSEVSKGWGSPKELDDAKSSQGWGLPNGGGADDAEKHQQWGKPKLSEVSQGWGSPKESGDAMSSHGWGLKKNRPEGSRGWGTHNREWKGKSRPPKSQGNVNDDSSVGVMFTATRQRLDMFTSQEQDILSEIEPLMRSIRRIMHQSGYSDGDALSVADQSYVLDNVFNHHPDKATKMGASIEHVMVDKHSIFAETRCFYVVSTDGSKQDFSYRKCLENLIRGKYPDLAEEFIEKYFTKPRPRAKQQQNREMDKSGDDNQQQQDHDMEKSRDDSQVQKPISGGISDDNQQ